MSKFNWQLASAEEIASYIGDGKENVLRQQVNYYKLCNNNAMLDRIAKAKKLVLLAKLELQIATLKAELV
jgi:hypothetical protein